MTWRALFNRPSYKVLCPKRKTFALKRIRLQGREKETIEGRHSPSCLPAFVLFIPSSVKLHFIL